MKSVFQTSTCFVDSVRKYAILRYCDCESHPHVNSGGGGCGAG